MAETNPTATDIETNEQANNQGAQEASAEKENKNPSYDELFSKLDSAMEKRFDGLAKSMLKGNGVADDELAGIADAYKEYRSGKKEESKQALTQMQAENAALKEQVVNMQVQSIATNAAATLGIDPNSVKYVTKLADFSNCIDEKGAPDETKIVEAMKEVLDNVPAFRKAAEQQNNGFKIGADSSQGNAENEQDSRLRKAFGLK